MTDEEAAQELEKFEPPTFEARRLGAAALRVKGQLVEALEAASFTLTPGNVLICRRCLQPSETHRPETCETAAALKAAKETP